MTHPAAVAPWHWSALADTWTLEPAVAALSALLAAGYLAGVRRRRRTGGADGDGPWPWHRTAAFLGGLAVWVWTTCSGLGAYERVLFTDRAVQLVLLLMLVPMLLALGAPVSLLADALPAAGRARLRAALSGRTSRVLMFPLVSTVLLVAPPWLLYFTPLYGRTLTDPLGNTAFHLVLVLIGLLYFWPRLQLDPVAHAYPLMIGVVITFVEVVFDAALALVLLYGGHVIAEPYYAGLARDWGPTLARDQFVGGNAIWILGDLVGLPFLCALIRRLIVTGRAETAAVDAALDAVEEARAVAAATAVAAGTDAPAGDRPWWLDDPNLRHRYGG
ncbi:cytochrome c oxidase assembly protein [Kitasatospora cineracea]|uniref:cytochrome c oxidase assembly protein n=1 Tax=Kitasatospora TaxID=2063 RepID=UPI00068A9E62|nr:MULTISPECIES: cytochrome c oxidase assembly protein [unclassified Kitasatospora]WAL70617.1 cytochrome c oxidase assembly protein [Kitasatospora sp. YST-16]WNW36658.1 cytochrome c oxidase assembly protein [Streptomyces sp. Li-HN-5-13]